MERMFAAFLPVVKAAEGEGVFEATINTAAKDRQGQIVLPSGAKTENYMKNPVVLYGHDYGSLPVAKALAIYPDGDNLVARFQFPPAGASAQADTVRNLWQSGFLNATSIGFVAQKWLHEGRENDQMDLWMPDTVITEWELLEFSIVPVPANQEALRRMFEPQGKEGRVLSTKTRARITASLSKITEAAKDIKALLAETEPADDNQDNADNDDPDKAADPWPAVLDALRSIKTLLEG